MLTSSVYRSRFSSPNLCPLHKPLDRSVGGHGRPFFPVQPKPEFRRSTQKRLQCIPSTIETISTASAPAELPISVIAVVTLDARSGDCISDMCNRTLTLKLFSTELDPETGVEKEPLEVHVSRDWTFADSEEVKYEADVSIPPKFGELGAVAVENEHRHEAYVMEIVLHGFPNGPLTITCNSYVQPNSAHYPQRIFFPNKSSYLPSQTPSGLKRLRRDELTNLQGNREGERQTGDRIYDYDVYNDLGDPDKDLELLRPVLGGKEFPYPRRCRTGRPPCNTDKSSETRTSSIYVPRDEQFSPVKQRSFFSKVLYSAAHAAIPAFETRFGQNDLDFRDFTEVDELYNEGFKLPQADRKGSLLDIIPRIINFLEDIDENVLRFETPELIRRDKFSWLKDEEFSRQTLAGLNPLSIRLVTPEEWPLKSKLDPSTYGPPESAITTKLVEKELKGLITVEEALKSQKLFILDYHDLLLPYVSKVRGIDPKTLITTLYGSRTLFFLTHAGTLRPIAIELTRPPFGGNPQWKKVFTPTSDRTGFWLWRLAKAHVLAHDTGYHELVSHWLRTHCAVEPFVIAANRQLSAMHPIYRLLYPHWRYTLAINAFARQSLINAGGIIESGFSPGKYSMELSAVAYKQQWRFDLQGLPADLIHRGMAVEDPSGSYGLRLTIEDYPYANDGLILWAAIKEWVSDYVMHYYPQSGMVESDEELQEWWKEIKSEGHPDKKEGWPELKTPEDLVEILTTMIWVPSAHHSAVNFGQYGYAGYFPNRPAIARRKIPTEDLTDLKMLEPFMEQPDEALLTTLPCQFQAVRVLVVLDLLSDHSPDEEYIGEKITPTWKQNAVITAAFEKFQRRLEDLERTIDFRNDPQNGFKNRTGAGVVPYELLKPLSGPGVTGKGVPNSISI